MALKNFTGAVAVITGGASGIGLATAKAFCDKGMSIVLADINEQGLQKAKQQVQEHSPRSTEQVLTVATDVTSEAQVQALMHQARATYGRIDLVMTSAGIGRGGAIDDFTGAEMEMMMNINFMGTYHCVRAALPVMREQQGGHFVCLSSVAGKLASPLLSGYVASKWAVRGFTMAVRAELYGTGIGITTVYPAWVETPMIHQEADTMQFLHVQALLTAEQVANEIVQAVEEDKRDLTLAPNPDIALLLKILHDDPDKAEELVGKNYYEHLRPRLEKQSH